MVKWRESGTTTLELEDDDEDEKKQQQQQRVVVVGLGEHGGAVVKKQAKQQGPVAAHARVHCRVGAAAAGKVKAMDQDLYHIPPDMLCHDPRVSRASLILTHTTLLVHYIQLVGYCTDSSWTSEIIIVDFLAKHMLHASIF